MKYIPHMYQGRAINHVKENLVSALFLEMGLGKSSIILTAFNDLKYDMFECGAVLIIAPLRVALLTWAQEAKKWDHLKHLRVQVLHGPDKDRNLYKNADVYVINYDGLAWFQRALKSGAGKVLLPKIGMLVFDESTMIKAPRAKRSKIAKLLSGVIPRRVILSGTPTPNNLVDIWNQVYMLDHGERLGSTFGGFKSRYFVTTGYLGYSLKPMKGSADAITDMISDISLTMKAEDHLDMPDKIENKVEVVLPKKLMAQYEDFEKEFLLELEGVDVAAFNAASLSAKLRQFVQGFVYDTETETAHDVHDEKIKALREIHDGSGSPILVAIQFRYEAELLKKEFGDDLPIIYGGTKTSDTIKYVEQWNSGNIPILVAHPASLAHGVNLQSGGSTVVWLGIPFNLEYYLQFNARLYRQGQTRACIIHHVIVKNTIDEAVYAAVRGKEKNQAAILAKLKEYREVRDDR